MWAERQTGSSASRPPMRSRPAAGGSFTMTADSRSGARPEIDTPVPLGITMAVAGSVRQRLDQLFQQRIVIFDGSMGVMLQHKGLSDEEFRGERFRNHPKPLRNNSDVLCLTQPNLVTQVHREYLEAGADIITTHTFSATRVSPADYGLEGVAYEMNLEGGRLPRKAADAHEDRFVARRVGPTHSNL